MPSTGAQQRGSPGTGRVLGVDPGTVRIGLALSDAQRLVATPLSTVAAGEDAVQRIAEAAGEHEVAEVVVGLPTALSGGDTPSTGMARQLAADLRAVGLSVTLWDERLSSAEAERVLLAGGRRRAQRRDERDRLAATLILQGWLDATSRAHQGADTVERQWR